jgi:hypothetical protein
MAKGQQVVVRDALLRDDDLLLGQCEVDMFRSSGPGGQKKNKTSSAVRLRHAATGLSAIGSEERSQHVNKRRALRRLRETMAVERREPLERLTYKPSDLLRTYITREGSVAVNRKNHDFALVTAEVLDVIEACEYRVPEAAEYLGITTSKLVKFLQEWRRVWDYVNHARAKLGLKPLR